MGEEKEIPPADRYLESVFGQQGYLSKVVPGYRPRAGQVAFAEAVDRAIRGRTHLLAEAGTGTGKSLAYSAPASYFAAMTGKPVVIVTANIALQEQIFNKDLPLLRKAVPWQFSFALLKGKNNFLCVDRFLGDGAQAKIPESSEERRQLPVVQAWARECMKQGPGFEEGDVSDLPFEPLHSVWRRFSVSADECKGQKCRYRHECFALASTERAKQSSVIVTNYHLFFAHLRVYLTSGLDLVLSPFSVAILDEGHKAPDIARDFFGFSFSEGTIRSIVHRLTRRFDVGDKWFLEHKAQRFFGTMAALRHDQKRYKSRLTKEYEPHELEAWNELKQGFADVAKFTSVEYRKLEDEIAKHDALDEERDDMLDDLADIEKIHDRVLEVASGIRRAMERPEEGEKDDDHVFYLEENQEKKTVSVCSKLVEANVVLAPGLFGKRIGIRDPETKEPVDGGPVSVIVTSATLATDGGSFEYMGNELGAPREIATLVADSPFNWPEQCLFCVPDTMPEPNAPEFRDAVAKHVERVIALAGGRTLCLFTSRRVLEHTYDAVSGYCFKQKIKIMRQGDAPRTKLIADFKSDVSSVLLGTESFWAGVDVPGEACSVVVIDRLPFPSPDDPVLDALQSRDDKAFWRYSIPRSIIQFKQGFGRLVRSMECRGVVVCLDQRITSKRYGKQFLKAIPNVPKTVRLDAIAEWLSPPKAAAWDE